MSIFTVASRYAKSLLDLSKEQGNLDTVKTDVDGIIALLKSNTELQAVLKNPIINTDKKIDVLKAILEGKVNPLIIAFFQILVTKGRAAIILEIAQEFVREYNIVNGIVKATVTSASPLSAENIAVLESKIAEELNAKVLLTNAVDAGLIGGFVVRVGDRQVDASIAGKLNKLEKHFATQGV